MNESTILLLVVCSLPILWTGILYFASWIGGWRLLASEYGATERPDGTSFHWQHASLRGVANYSCCLTFVSNPEGFYVQPALLLRPGHAPFFVPWTDVVSAQESGKGWFQQVTFRFAQTPTVSFAVSKQFAKRMLEFARTDEPAFRELDIV